MANYGSRMSFRSRKVDYKKSLLILRDSDAPDIDTVASQRSAVQIETGVEKEEEEEHHLKAAILASQAAYTGGNVASKYIPTPDASKVVEDYNSLYSPDFKLPFSLISYDDIYEESIGTSYCLDEFDQNALKDLTDPTLKKLRESRFEEIVTLLEEAATDGRLNIKDENPAVPLDIQTSLKSMNPKSKSLDSHIDFVFKHWLKRRRAMASGEPIMPRLRIDRSSKSENDPYLCFKRREMKLHRRTRATDSFYVSKLIKLREDVKACYEIVSVTLQREETLGELIKVQDQIVKLRDVICKKRVAAQYSTPSNIPPLKKPKIVEDEPEAPVVQKPKPKPKTKRVANTRRRVEDAGWHDITDVSQTFSVGKSSSARILILCSKNLLLFSLFCQLPYQFPSIPLPQKFYCYPPAIVPNSSHQDVCYRRRRGRGGRFIVDRCQFNAHERPAADYLNPDWVENNIPTYNEVSAISLRSTNQLLTEQDQSRMQPSLRSGSLHHSDNPPLPHGLLEGKLAAALAAQKSSTVVLVPEIDTNEQPPLDVPKLSNFPASADR